MIERPKLNLGEYGDLFEYTDAERDAVSRYTGMSYKIINSLFVNNDGKYEIRNGMKNEFVPQNETDREYYVKKLQETIQGIPQIYAAMLKSEILSGRNRRMQVLHRGTSLSEINSISIGSTIDRIVSTTEVFEGANWESYMFNENKDAPVHMQVRIDPNSRSFSNACIRDFRGLFWLGKRNYCCSFC